MSLVDLVAGSVVRVGSGNKAAVLAIQTALGITADGDFGDGTEAAVEAFQRAHDLTDDGAVGHMTATAIDAVAAASRSLPITIKDMTGHANTNPMSIVPNGAETIDGLSPYSVGSDFGGVQLIPQTGGYMVAP
jgi:peptidoglycan hydrolase-like protein with peptidoglycan-binding domain